MMNCYVVNLGTFSKNATIRQIISSLFSVNSKIFRVIRSF